MVSIRTVSLTLANLLLPTAVLIFATGFFPYKPVLPGLAEWDDGAEGGAEVDNAVHAPFNKVVFMVVDALRSDFVFGEDSAMEFVQNLIRTGAAIPFTAHATPPTVTMPRVKALTTGSVPSFLDLILNFAESDTSSSLAAQDTWLAQLRRRGRGQKEENVVFYGDDTWLKLFPGDFFGRSEGTSSFFVSDFTEVDNNVTRHLPAELQRPDWNALIMHYLGLDHIGHKTGPQGPAMLPKQREMDDIVRMIYEAVQTEEHLKDTLVVLVGDHGMNAGGNHGGSGPGETEPALVFASPKFAGIQTRPCPTEPKEGTEFEFYRKVQQSDVVPTLASLMGFPIPKNSLGVVLQETAESLLGDEAWVRSLKRNAKQVLVILKASLGEDRWQAAVNRYTQQSVNCENLSDEEEMACLWATAIRSKGTTDEKEAYSRFLYKTQDALSSTASSYDVPRMVAGVSIAAVSLILAIFAFPSTWPPTLGGSSLTFTTLLYGVMMFATSYVEEEQHFWYWLTPAWLAFLGARSLQQGNRMRLPGDWNLPSAALVLPILACHRLMLRWNQTGQKHSGEADIAHTFFPSHHVLMWLLILITYLVIGLQLARTCLRSATIGDADLAIAFVVILPAVVFKLNFTQADAPELVLGLGENLRKVTANIDLVSQARVVFVMLTLCLILACVEAKWSSRKYNAKSSPITLADRLHVLLTLFLMTQTRAPNIPLFLLLEGQRLCFKRLLFHPTTAISANPQALPVALSSLLLSQTAYFAFGGSNSISSIDLSNAYNGVADYNILAVGVLLFASNWAGAIWWCSAAVTLLLPRPQAEQPPAQSKSTSGSRAWVELERAKLHADAVAAVTPPKTATIVATPSRNIDSWTIYTTATTAFTAASLVAVMAACTLLRTHLFIWTVFSPKYLYAMAWAVGWHLIVCCGLGRLLWVLGRSV